MGMILGLHTLSDDSIHQVLGCPALIWRVLAPDDPEILAEAMAQGQKPGFLSRLFKRKQAPAPSTLPDLPLAEGEVEETDLDKAWHGIHFLLTGSDWEGEAPLNFLLAGGVEAGDIDVGYGPARVYLSPDVRAINEALAGIEEEGLRRRFQPDEMMKKEIYPEIWDRNPKEDDTLGYLVEYFNGLKEFVSLAAGKGLGLVITLQ